MIPKSFIFFKEMCNLRKFLPQTRVPASCVDNVTENGKVVKGYVCQSTVVPSEIRGQSMVSSQPFVIGDSLIGTDLIFSFTLS